MTRFGPAIVAILLTIAPTLALDGQPAMHDPSTVIAAGEKFYVYATGNGLPAFESDDGWTWRRTGSVMQGVPGGKPGPDVIARGGNNTWAPDIIRSGDKYFLYYSAPGTQPKAAVGLLVGRTLDPASPDYKWEDAGPVVWSDGVEDSNAIDPGVMRDPSNGTMWLTYGSYFGYIRLVELDPKTGKRLHPEAKPVNIAINSEASVMIFHDGWYYLLVTHGSCAPARTPATTFAWADPERSRARSSTTWGATCCRAAASCSPDRAAGTSGRDISGCWTWATACRSFPVITKRISIGAGSVCSTFVRCCGATAGRSPVTT
jgi:hypothetical protein